MEKKERDLINKAIELFCEEKNINLFCRPTEEDLESLVKLNKWKYGELKLTKPAHGLKVHMDVPKKFQKKEIQNYLSNAGINYQEIKYFKHQELYFTEIGRLEVYFSPTISIQ